MDCFRITEEQHKTQPAKFHELVLRQPSLLETTGAIIGFAGASKAMNLLFFLSHGSYYFKETNLPSAITIVMSSHVASGDQTVTVQGDLAAVLGAIAMAIYLSVGRWLRNAKKLTLWMYVFPVTLAAALVNSIGSTIFETGVGFAQRDSRYVTKNNTMVITYYCMCTICLLHTEDGLDGSSICEKPDWCLH